MLLLSDLLFVLYTFNHTITQKQPESFNCFKTEYLNSRIIYRLPIVQAGTYAVLVPTLSYLSLTQNQCPLIVPQNNNTGGNKLL